MLTNLLIRHKNSVKTLKGTAWGTANFSYSTRLNVCFVLSDLGNVQDNCVCNMDQNAQVLLLTIQEFVNYNTVLICLQSLLYGYVVIFIFFILQNPFYYDEGVIQDFLSYVRKLFIKKPSMIGYCLTFQLAIL
jgi:hypothetical protein